VEEIRSVTRRAFDNLVEHAIDEEVDFVLLAGDLHDGGWKDYTTGLYFSERMGRLREAGIWVFMVAGNVFILRCGLIDLAQKHQPFLMTMPLGAGSQYFSC